MSSSLSSRNKISTNGSQPSQTIFLLSPSSSRALPNLENNVNYSRYSIESPLNYVQNSISNQETRASQSKMSLSNPSDLISGYVDGFSSQLPRTATPINFSNSSLDGYFLNSGSEVCHLNPPSAHTSSTQNSVNETHSLNDLLIDSNDVSPSFNETDLDSKSSSDNLNNINQSSCIKNRESYTSETFINTFPSVITGMKRQAVSEEETNLNNSNNSSNSISNGNNNNSNSNNTCNNSSNNNNNNSFNLRPENASSLGSVKKRKSKNSGPPIRPQCTECGKDFSNQSALSKHKLTHSDERRFVCSLCQKAFKRQDHLNGHMLTHRDKKPYECDVEGCEKTYCDARSLRRHKENHHSVGFQQISNNAQINLTLVPRSLFNKIQYAPVLGPDQQLSNMPSAATHLQLLALSQQGQTGNHSQHLSNQSPLSNEKNVAIKSEIGNDFRSDNSLNSRKTSNDPNNLLHQLLTQHHLKQNSQENNNTFTQLSNAFNNSNLNNDISLDNNTFSGNGWAYVQQINKFIDSQVNQVECSQCQRKFKNLPALNGHMRLHGGYTKNLQAPLNNFSVMEKKKELNNEVEGKANALEAIKKRLQKNASSIVNDNENENCGNSSCNDRSKTNCALKSSNPLVDMMNTSVSLQNQNVSCYPFQDINSSCLSTTYLSSHLSENKIISDQSSHTDFSRNHSNISNSTQLSSHSTQAKLHLNNLQDESDSVHHTFSDHSSQDLDRFLSNKGTEEEIKSQTSDNNMDSNWELFKEKFQQFRIPLQAASINSVNSSLLAKNKVLYSTSGEKFRRHSDSTAEMVFSSNSIYYSNRNRPWISGNHLVNSPVSSHEFISSFDTLKPRSQRATSDPGNEELEEDDEEEDDEEDDEEEIEMNGHHSQQHHHHNHHHSQHHHHPQQPSCSQILNNDSSMISLNANKNFPHNSHYQYDYSHSIHSHSLPTTPTNLNPLLSPAAAPSHQITNQTHFNQSLPCTPTQSNSFTFSPHQIQQYHQQQQSISSTSTESQLHFTYTSPQDTAQYSNLSYNLNNQPTTAYSYSSHDSQTHSVAQQQQPPPPPSLPPPQPSQQPNQSAFDPIYEDITFATNQGDTIHHNEVTFDADFEMDSLIEQIRNHSEPPRQAISENSQQNFFTENNLDNRQPIDQSGLNFSNQSHFSNLELQNISSIDETSDHVLHENNCINHTQVHQENDQDKLFKEIKEKSNSLLEENSVSINNPSSYPSESVSRSTPRSSSLNLVINLSPEEKSGKKMNFQSEDEEDDEDGEEEVDDVFVSPGTISPIDYPQSKGSIKSSIKDSSSNKRPKHRPEPLYIPPHVNTFGQYASRLRSPRLWDPAGHHNSSPHQDLSKTSPPPYTPPPMLSPLRKGSGLYWAIINNGSVTPKSGSFIYSRKSISTPGDKDGTSQTNELLLSTPKTAYESDICYDIDLLTTENDVQPHVNIGPQYQASIPAFIGEKDDCNLRYKRERADKVWDPLVLNNSLTSEDIQHYLELSCSGCVPGAGRNIELALHILYLTQGDLHQAISKLLNVNSNKLKRNHPLFDYSYPESDLWSKEEITAYYQALIQFDKDFHTIAKKVGTKTVKECIQFYYLWKKICPEEYKRMRVIRRKKEQERIYYNNTVITREENSLENNGGDVNKDDNLSLSAFDSPMNASPCSASSNATSTTTSTINSKEARKIDYPCKICGKTFSKVKSRSAHMKIHGAGATSR